MSRQLAPLRPAILFLATLAPVASRSEASPSRSTVEYSTTGTIGDASVAGAPVVRFEGLDGASVTVPDALQSGEIPVTIPDGYGTAASLGSFVASTPPADGVTIYSHTPFEIDLHIKSIDGAAPSPGQETVAIRGWLDGTLAGASPSAITAHYALSGYFGVPWEPLDKVGDFRAGLSTLSLTIPRVTTTLNLPSYSDSTTDISATIITNAPLPSPAPEPGTLAIFVVAAAALAVRARGRSLVRRGGI